MAGKASHVQQSAALLKQSEAATQAIRVCVESIVESPAFKGSKRSQEFLRVVVDKALDGLVEDLKERMLGVELFGRVPTYDTGTDAIVRVTACDVRRRLQQYYSSGEDLSGFRIELPPGSYVPEFHSAPEESSGGAAETAPVTGEPVESAMLAVEPHGSAAPARGWKWLWPLCGSGAAVALALAFWLGPTRSSAAPAARTLLPWSAVSPVQGKMHIVFCDPEIVTLQRLANYTVTLSDYANHRYWPETIKPETQRVMDLVIFRGTNVAAVDAAMATKISRLGAGSGNQIETHPARTMRLTDFNTDDSFVLFGSPRSNPWVGLFEDQLDFRFEFDAAPGSEVIRNLHPREGEAGTYVPTAEGWGTGEAYAIAALVKNPNHDGYVLILAGSNAEATEAAGSFATNLTLLAQTLQKYGIQPHGAPQPFEFLLKVSAMAGSSSTFEVIAGHRLQEKAR